MGALYRRLFETTSKAHPEDSELQLALGVLHHLNRRYDAAIAAFQRALELRPGDYRCAHTSAAVVQSTDIAAVAGCMLCGLGVGVGAHPVRRCASMWRRC